MMEEADMKKKYLLRKGLSLFLFYRILAYLNFTFKFLIKNVNFF